MESLIIIYMGIMSKHGVYATHLPNTPTTREDLFYQTIALRSIT
jgi:hypothetical protein